MSSWLIMLVMPWLPAMSLLSTKNVASDQWKGDALQEQKQKGDPLQETAASNVTTATMAIITVTACFAPRSLSSQAYTQPDSRLCAS